MPDQPAKPVKFGTQKSKPGRVATTAAPEEKRSSKFFFICSRRVSYLSTPSLSPCPPQVVRQKVPLELEKGEMPLNTFNNKAPFKVK